MSPLKLRIPKNIWNSHNPKAHHDPKKQASNLKLKFPRNQINKATAQRQHRPLPQPLPHCKVKLWRFHYGGPKRKTKGESKNKITYEQPCLRVTCANCWMWHAHLLRVERMSSEVMRRGSDGMVRNGRFRYCVRLVFGSVEGREGFRRIVGRGSR